VARDILRDLSESAARTLGTTPEQLDVAWDRAELRIAERALAKRGLQLPAALDTRARVVDESRAVTLPDPRRGGLKQVSGPSTDVGPSVIPTWEVGQPKYPRQSFGNWVEEGYRKNEVAHSCVRELAQSASEPRLRVKLSREKDAPYVDNHPARLFIEKPNESTSESAWLSQLITLGVVGGNALAWKERAGGGRVVAMRWLRADRVKLVRRADGSIEKYRYQNGTREVDLPAEDVFHFPWAFDPVNPGWGLSPFAVLARAISVDNTVTDFQAKFFEQAAVPYGLITTDQMILDDDAERIAERWQQRYGGMEGWHRPAVLGQGARYERMALNMSEMQLDSLRAADEARICAVFQVPPILVGAKVGLDRSTFSNYAEARRSFWAETLRPVYRQIEDTFNLSIAPEFGSTVRFEFDLSDVGALQADEQEKWTRAGTAFMQGWVSDNEARSEVGLDPWPVARRMLTISQVPESAPQASDRSGRSSLGVVDVKQAVPVKTSRELKQVDDELLRTYVRSERSLVPPFDTRMRKLYRAIATHAADVARGSAKSETKQLPPVSELLSADHRDELELELTRFRDLVGEQTIELLNGLYPLGASYDPDPGYYGKVSESVALMWQGLHDRLSTLLSYATEHEWSADQLVNGDDSHAGIVGAIAGSSGDDREGVHMLTSVTARIAVSEYVAARNDASVMAYSQGGVSFVDVRDGTDHDAACAAANGSRWTLEQAIANDKEHPNCRRVFAPVFAGG
jgi:HK97 family phage portal protein